MEVRDLNRINGIRENIERRQELDYENKSVETEPCIMLPAL